MTPPVTVIGCDGGPLRPAAAAAVAASVLVAGARRLLEAIAVPDTATQVQITRLDDALDQLCQSPGPVAVLASGDPGFFGIVRALRARGIVPRVIPAVSSVALAFARLGLDWDDALVLSAHGRSPRPVAAAALAHPKVAILTAPGEGTAELATALLAAGRRVYVAERLGEPAERVAELTGAEAADLADPNVLVAVDPATPTTLVPAESDHRPGGGSGCRPAGLARLGGRASRRAGLGAAGGILRAPGLDDH